MTKREPKNLCCAKCAVSIRDSGLHNLCAVCFENFIPYVDLRTHGVLTSDQRKKRLRQFIHDRTPRYAVYVVPELLKETEEEAAA
jgi:hypothetical protein